MERLYNPDLMPKEEIKATFVARQDLVDEIVSLIKHQPKGAGVQHAVIIAPRGMGKTTVLLMVRFAIQDSTIAKQWQAVQFPEERYNIYDLADFWLEVLSHLDEATNGDELRRQIEDLRQRFKNNDDLQEGAFALIKDWSRKHKRRLVVLVDNFDMILEQINDERDNARLRDVLMNDGTMMLIGGATTFFHEARAYNQPLYNFFKLYELPNLKFEQMQELLRRRAALDDQENFEETLNFNRSRLRVLEHFTGGNPRLVLMLYRVVTQSDISEVRLGLEKLLDEVTPFFKLKVETLPPQQRKILDHIAHVSSQTNEGLTPTEIAAATRMTPNQASAQLKRLVENGYVQAANLRGRRSYYTLSERLYAIWHQMRFGRNARERMGWLVNFLKALYNTEEMDAQSTLLEGHFLKHFISGRFKEAGNTSEHLRFLLEAKKDLSRGDRGTSPSPVMDERAELDIAPEGKFQFQREHKWGAALQQFSDCLEINADYMGLWVGKAFLLLQLHRHEEALTSIEQALQLDGSYPSSLYLRGIILRQLGRDAEAIDSFDRAHEIGVKLPQVWSLHAVIYLSKFLRRLDEGRLELAKRIWDDLQLTAAQLNDDALHELISTILLRQALQGSVQFVRQLIEDSRLVEPLFPLARAIDYAQTGDEALIEKLSPEVRGVVEEIVAKLHQTDGQKDKGLSKTRVRKLKSGSRLRTRKQLD